MGDDAKTTGRTVRIGCHAAFWGDSIRNAAQLVLRAELDYLVSDYLSEITMSLLVRARAKDAAAGYAPDFVASVGPVLAEMKRRGIRAVTNAGGINPRACRDALVAEAAARGVPLRVAIVEGDDLMPQLARVRAAAPREMFSGEALPAAPLSMNAYLGATPIARALDDGADVVVCGRCADSALALGVLLHEFRWGTADYDLLAAGSLAGHVIECGAQAAGGIFTDWESVAPGWDDMGMPIAECAADGSFAVTKAPGTGGAVTVATVAEQILYEIGDPQHYLLPDVDCDFRNVVLVDLGGDRVAVSGARGRPPTPDYKVSATYQDGYRLVAPLVIAGNDAVAKARRTAEAILARASRILTESGFPPFVETAFEVIGSEGCYGAQARGAANREVVLRIAARHADRRALEVLASEIAPAGVSMAQGTAGLGGGRPAPSPVVRLFSFLYPKADVGVRVELEGNAADVAPALGAARAPAGGAQPPPEPPRDASAPDGMRSVPLRAIAVGRSGDKGDLCNVGVIARRPEYYPLIAAQFPAERVARRFAHYARGPVERFALPGLLAYNFVLHGALGGGGMASLRYDPQGKAFAQILLDDPVRVPAEWLRAGGPLERYAEEAT